MKKIVAFVLTLMLASMVLATPVMATETTSEVIATYEDGSYLLKETTTVTTTAARGSTISKSGSVTIHYCNGNDVEQWNYTLYGTFLYREGIGAQAQNRSDAYKIYNSEWSLVSHDTSLDARYVYGTVTMKCTILLITVRTVTNNLSITCDAYGNLTYTP